MLQIYTDGAYKSSIDQGGIGIVWMKNNEVFKNADSWKSLSHYYIAENANQSNNYTNFKTIIVFLT